MQNYRQSVRVNGIISESRAVSSWDFERFEFHGKIIWINIVATMMWFQVNKYGTGTGAPNTTYEPIHLTFGILRWSESRTIFEDHSDCSECPVSILWRRKIIRAIEGMQYPGRGPGYREMYSWCLGYAEWASQYPEYPVECAWKYAEYLFVFTASMLHASLYRYGRYSTTALFRYISTY